MVPPHLSVIEYRSRNRHRNLWIAHCVSSWWSLVWFKCKHESYGFILYVLKVLTDWGRDGLLWPAFSGHSLFCTGIGFDFFINISYWCVCNNTPRNDVSALVSSLRTWLWNVAIEVPFIVFSSQPGYSSGAYQALWLAVCVWFGIVD